MVDREQREHLSEALSKLVGGQMTNDQFDDLYFAQWAESSDLGVREVAGFGYSLYSSDLPLPYRLDGRHAVDAETRQVAERCLRFLRADLEYAWPERPNQTLDCISGGLSMQLVLPLGVVLLLAGFIDTGFVIAGVLVLLLGYGLWRASRSMNTPERWAYRAAGDEDAWPFLRRADSETAQGQLNGAQAGTKRPNQSELEKRRLL
jgi:hypothetical protein